MYLPMPVLWALLWSAGTFSFPPANLPLSQPLGRPHYDENMTAIKEIYSLKSTT
jgi:hypothetical protein